MEFGPPAATFEWHVSHEMATYHQKQMQKMELIFIFLWMHLHLKKCLEKIIFSNWKFIMKIKLWISNSAWGHSYFSLFWLWKLKCSRIEGQLVFLPKGGWWNLGPLQLLLNGMCLMRWQPIIKTICRKSGIDIHIFMNAHALEKVPWDHHENQIVNFQFCLGGILNFKYFDNEI